MSAAAAAMMPQCAGCARGGWGAADITSSMWVKTQRMGRTFVVFVGDALQGVGGLAEHSPPHCLLYKAQHRNNLRGDKVAQLLEYL